jgi:riboflavin transporter FmnP
MGLFVARRGEACALCIEVATIPAGTTNCRLGIAMGILAVSVAVASFLAGQEIFHARAAFTVIRRKTIIVSVAVAGAIQRHGAFLANKGFSDVSAFALGHRDTISESIASIVTEAGIVAFNVVRPARIGIIHTLVVCAARRRIAQ